MERSWYHTVHMGCDQQVLCPYIPQIILNFPFLLWTCKFNLKYVVFGCALKARCDPHGVISAQGTFSKPDPASGISYKQLSFLGNLLAEGLLASQDFFLTLSHTPPFSCRHWLTLGCSTSLHSQRTTGSAGSWDTYVKYVVSCFLGGFSLCSPSHALSWRT